MTRTYEHFHPGEVQVQAEWGTDTDAYEAASHQMMLPEMNPNEAEFILGRTFSAAGTIDAEGRPWASPLFAADSPLFDIRSLTEVRIGPAPSPGDPLVENIRATGELGVLYFDPSTRRRAKSIGRGEMVDEHTIDYRMTRLFGLCPKYIFKRHHTPATEAAVGTPASSTALSAEDREQLERSDTAFLASFSPHGADVTHRGGAPGFIRVLDDSTVEMPDYFGNGMFNTLGNLVLDDRLGLTVTDLETGRTVHLTGRAVARATGKSLPDPERSITLGIEEVRVSWSAAGTWIDDGPSRYTPDV